MLVYRITSKAYASDLSGAGSMIDGRRWNSRTNPMLYTSSSRSLALLEVLAHSTILPVNLVIVTLRLPPRIRIQELTHLPEGWDQSPSSAVSQAIGDEFLRAGKFLALRVPSVIIKEESNILINPRHRLSNKIEVVNMAPIPVDTRLKE